MSRVSVAERTKLSVFLARGLVRKLTSRVTTHPIVHWPFSFGKADRLVIAPQDLRTTDATRASEIYAGRFVFAGKVVICDARSPFEITPPSEDWAVALLGFGWLRHLRAAESGITRANARALVDEWIALNSAHDADRLASRCGRAARHLLAQPGAADARRCRRAVLSPLPAQPDAAGPLSAAYGVARRATACRACRPRSRSPTPRCAWRGSSATSAPPPSACREELERQILPDGGHISRNPGALIELLVDLLPLRTAFTARNIAPPPPLLNAIDRMMPMLRFFRHGDGNFALFNGMGPTQTDLLTTILAYDDARGAPLANAPHSGYQRLESAGTLVLMDTGRAPPMRGEPGGPCRLPVVRALGQAEPHRGQLRIAVDQPRKLAAGGARDRGAFHRHAQRYVVVPFRRLRAAQAHAVRHADDRRSAPGHRGARGTARRRACCAPRTTAMPTSSTSSTSAC